MILNNEHVDTETKKKTGSIYTPLYIVEKMMAKVEDEFWSDPTKTFCDPTCGVGNIIIPMLDNRVKHGIDPTVALKTMYGNELLKESYDILMQNLQEWADKHWVTDTSWKENFYNEDFFNFIQLVQNPNTIDEFFVDISNNKIYVSLFLMNPPYGDSKNPQLCCRILNKIKDKRAVIIAPPPSVFRSLYFHITTVEIEKFPMIDYSTIIVTINDNKENMFKTQYRYIFSPTPTQFYIQNRQSFCGSIKTKYGLKIRKIGVDKECDCKIYLKMTDEERDFINKMIDETDMSLWQTLYSRTINGPRFLVPNLIAKTKYKYLVKEVKEK